MKPIKSGFYLLGLNDGTSAIMVNLKTDRKLYWDTPEARKMAGRSGTWLGKVDGEFRLITDVDDKTYFELVECSAVTSQGNGSPEPGTPVGEFVEKAERILLKLYARDVAPIIATLPPQ